MRISIRDEKVVLLVIDLCMALEEKALLVYQGLRDSATDSRMRALWAALAADEKEHRGYWLRLKEVCAAGGVPEIFDEPRRYADELLALQHRLDHIAEQVRADFRPPGVFIHALHLEFLLLHPAVVTLFHYLPDAPEVRSPSRTYEQHLGKLLNTLMDFESLPPELELLGEAIGQVWRKSEENATKSVTDLLTGTLNRRGLTIAMRPLAYLARRERQTAGVLLIEVANIKEVNHVHGRRAGDELLVATAAAVASRLRSSDVLGRFGGDDFLVLLTRFDPQRLEGIAREIAAVAGEVSVDGVSPGILVGGAWAVIGEDVERTLEDLIRAADGALLTAREGGSPCLVRALG